MICFPAAFSTYGSNQEHLRKYGQRINGHTKHHCEIRTVPSLRIVLDEEKNDDESEEGCNDEEKGRLAVDGVVCGRDLGEIVVFGDLLWGSLMGGSSVREGTRNDLIGIWNGILLGYL